MIRASSLVPVVWIYLSSSSRALLVTTGVRPNSLIRNNLASSHLLLYQQTSSASFTRGMSSKSDDEAPPRRKRVVRGSVKDAEEAPKTKKKKAKRGAGKTKDDISGDNNVEEESPSIPTKKPRVKSPPHQVLTERDELPKLWNASEHEDTSHSKLFSAAHVVWKSTSDVEY